MGTPFLSEIKICAFNFAPKGWALCNGQLLPINQNQALFSLLGTMYGGNGQVNFALPNLQGRVPFHVGNGLVQGESAGETAHTLIISEMPAHNHFAVGSSNSPSVSTPANNLWASNTGFSPYAATTNEAMNPAAITNIGGSQSHDNMSPYLVLNFCIALTGIFPSRN
jgi:microcystin-dependent protein